MSNLTSFQKKKKTDKLEVVVASVQNEIPHSRSYANERQIRGVYACLLVSQQFCRPIVTYFPYSLLLASCRLPLPFLLSSVSPPSFLSFHLDQSSAENLFYAGERLFSANTVSRAMNNDNGSVVTSLVEPRSTAACQTRRATVHAQSRSSVSDPALLHFFFLPPQTPLSSPLLLLCTALIVMLTRRSFVVSTLPALS